MAYRPYQERRRREAEGFETAKKTLHTSIEAWDLSKTSLENIVGVVLNQHQYRSGSDRNRMFGKLMGEARRHPKVVEYTKAVEAEKRRTEEERALWEERRVIQAEVQEELFQQGAVDHEKELNDGQYWNPGIDG
jgi:hypothetical protein